MNNEQLGQKALGGTARGTWQTISIPLTAATITTLSSAATADLSVRFTINLPAGSTVFLDRASFGQAPAGIGGSGGAGGSGGSAGSGGVGAGAASGSGGSPGGSGGAGGSSAGTAGAGGSFAAGGTGGSSGSAGNAGASGAAGGETIEFFIDLPRNVRREEIAIGTSEGKLDLRDGVRILRTGGFSSISSALAPGGLELGVQTELRSALSESPVLLRNDAIVHGDVLTTAQPVTLDAGARVEGVVAEFGSYFGSERHRWSVTFPPLATTVNREPGNPPAQLSPGAYASVRLGPNTRLELSPGTYFIRSLTVEPGAVLDIDNRMGSTRIYVRQDFLFHGTVSPRDSARANVLFAIAGTSAVNLESAFSGILVAPNAPVSLATTSVPHAGSFFARAVTVQAWTTVQHRPLTRTDLCESGECSGLCFCPPAPPPRCPTDFSCTGSEVCMQGGKCGVPGECETNADCAPGLVCGRKNGARFGLSAEANVCWAPRCNSVFAALNPCLSGNQSSTTCGVCPRCVPQCDGRTCGPDGCGGTCGRCSLTGSCVDGTCFFGGGEIPDVYSGPQPRPGRTPPTTQVGPDGFVAGDTSAEFSVNSNGEATYRVPLQTAPGRGGLQPELAIAYGSERGNGILGIGWSLEGLSAITRCAKTVSIDGIASAPRFDAFDALCLDGQRLVVAMDRSGEASPIVEYKTEIDVFSRIRAFFRREGGVLVGPDYFEVVQKGGKKLLYGSTSDSRIDGPSQSFPQTWAVSSIEDRAGNTMSVSYSEQQVMEGIRTREYYPTAIRYGRHSSEASASAPSAVAFHYIDRPDELSGWRNGIQMQVTRLLAGVDIVGPDGAFRHYAMGYQQESSNGRSTLVSLKECADVPLHGRTTWPACKRPISFRYNSNANQPVPFSLSATPSPFRSDRFAMDHSPEPFSGGRMPISRHSLDLNGDGRTDILTPLILGRKHSVGKAFGCTGEVFSAGSGSPTTIDGPRCIAQHALILSRPDQTYESLEVPIPLIQLAPSTQDTPALSRWDRMGRGYGVPVDLDNDGDDELLETDFAYQGQSQDNYSVVDFVDGQAVRRELPGVAYGISNQYLENFDFLSSFDNSPFAGAYVLDADGDGLKDVVTCSATSLTAGFSIWTLYRNRGTGVIETTLAPGATLSNLGPCKARNTAGLQHTVTDVDGDGREELILRQDVTVPGAQQIARFNLDNTVSLSPTDLSRLEGEVSAIPERMLDINGDGLMDFMQNDAGGIRFEVSRGDGTFQKYYTPTPNLGWSQAADNQIAVFSASATNDLNGDGLQDLVVLGPQGWRWLRSTGTNLVFESLAISLPIPADAMRSVSPVQGDFDGNGSDDVALVTFQGNWIVINTNGPVVPELNSITSSLGSTTTISYLPLKDSRIYETGSCVFPQHCEKRTARRVVESVSHWDAPLGEEMHAKQMRYKYQDARRDLPGRKWLGFANVSYQELVRGETDSSFRQMSSSRSSYDNATYDPLFKVYPFAHMLLSSQRAVNVSPSLVRLTQTSLDLDTTASTTLHPYVRSSLQVVREGPAEQTNRLVHAVARDFGVPDALGNPKTTAETWFDGPNATVPETRTRTATYAHELEPARIDAWQIDLVREVRETSSVPGLTSAGDPSGRKTRVLWFFHDPKGLLERKVRAPFGPSDLLQNEVLERDLYGNILKSTVNDGLGFVRSSSVIFDGVGLAPVTFINAKSQQTRVFVDSRFGLITRAIDPNNLIADTWFDNFGRVRMTIGPDNVATTYGYERTEQTPLRQTLDAEGGESLVFDFDVLARPVRTVRTGLGGLMFQARQYDNRGYLVRVERPHKSSVLTPEQTLVDYDDLGRLRTTVHPNGGTTVHCYADRMRCVQNARGFTSCSEQDARGGVVRSFDPVDGPELCESALSLVSSRASTNYTYGAFGDLRFVDDVSGNRRTIDTDEYGRKTDVDDPDAGPSKFFYNGFDELLEQHDANGNVRFVLPDALGRPVEQRDSTVSDPDNVRTTRWFWDGDGVDLPGELIGSLSAFESPDGNRGTLEYDANTGRVVASEQTREEITLRRAFAYDAFGRLKDVTHPAPLGRGPPSVRYVYDTSGHLTALQDLSTQLAPSGFFWKLDDLEPTDEYEQLRVEHLGNGVRTERTYHPTGASKSILSTRGGVPIQELLYDVDLVDNVTTRYDMVRLQWESFGYDKLDRLRCSKAGFGVPRKFNDNCLLPGGESPDFGQTLDALGRIASTGAFRTYAYGGSVLHAPREIEIRSQGTVTSFEYDDNGNRIREDNGLTARGISYTPFNKIREAWREGATPDDRLDVVSLEYDVFENRIAKRASGRTTVYFGSSYERRTAGGSAENVYFIEGPTGRVAQIKMADGAGVPEVRYLRPDHLGSIHIVTDEAGNVVDERSHAAFGRERNPVDWSDGTPPTSARQVDRGFTGHEEDAELGLTNMLGRHYDPDTSLFLQPDPYVQAPYFSQSLNRFAYVFNNPLKFVDPSGFQGTEKSNSAGGGGQASGGSSISPNSAVWADTGESFQGEPGQVVGVDGTPYAAVESGTGSGWLAFERSKSPDADQFSGAMLNAWGSNGNRGSSQSPGLNPGSSTADAPGQSSGAPAGGPGGPGASGVTSGASTGSPSGSSGGGGTGDPSRLRPPEDGSSKAWQDALIAAAFLNAAPPSSIRSDGTGSALGAPGGGCESCEGDRLWQVGYLLGTGLKFGALGAGLVPKAGATAVPAGGPTIDPSAVRFTQSSVSQTFSSGENINDVVRALQGPGGDLLAATFKPIRVFEGPGGQLFTLDNRRLLAFSQAGRAVPFVRASPAEVAASGFKFTATAEQAGGWFIRVK